MEANKENQQSIEQAFEQALDAYKAGNFAEAVSYTHLTLPTNLFV